MLLLQLIYTSLPIMNRLFQSAPFDPGAWFRIVAAGVIKYLIVEFEKWLRTKSMKKLTVQQT